MLKLLGALLGMGGFALTVYSEKGSALMWLAVVSCVAGLAILMTIGIRRQLNNRENYSLNQ